MAYRWIEFLSFFSACFPFHSIHLDSPSNRMQVYAQVTTLFSSAPDLLDEFKQFLPDPSGESHPSSHPPASSSSSVLPSSHPSSHSVNSSTVLTTAQGGQGQVGQRGTIRPASKEGGGSAKKAKVGARKDTVGGTGAGGAGKGKVSWAFLFWVGSEVEWVALGWWSGVG